MILSSEYMLTDKDNILNEVSKEANNLYNAALYQMRHEFIKKHNFINYNYLDKLFKEKYKNKENMLYHKLKYVQSAQQTLKEVNTIWYSWFKALKAYKTNSNKFTSKPKMPKYLPKGKRHTFFVTNASTKNKNGYLVISRLNIKVKLDENITKYKIMRVAFKPLSKNRFRMLIQYELPDKELKEDNGIYVGIDPGLNNAFTCATNANKRPLIINGKGAKSVNQFYNKKRAELYKKHSQYNQCYKEIYTKQGKKKVYYESNATLKITNWRNTKIRQFAHKATKSIIDYTLNCGANTIIIGYNKGLKRSSNLGKRVNQNFIGMPHNLMINMIEYKAKMNGIRVIKTNESYTSQTSFLDGEKPCKQNSNIERLHKGLSPINRRIHRGLFKSNKGILINADVNGAYQIIRKVFPKISVKDIDEIEGLVLNPVKYNINF